MSHDEAESFMKIQNDAIFRVAEILGIELEPDDENTRGNIMHELAETMDDEGNYSPEQAAESYKLLHPLPTRKVSRPTKSDKTRKKTPPKRTNPKTPPKRINPLTNRDKSNKSSKNRTRLKIQEAIDNGEQIEHEQIIKEKNDLESRLPKYLNGAKVEIIARDDHCLFRSIAHQLREYGFEVPGGYQQIRDLIADYIDKNIDKNISKDTIDIETDFQYETVKAYTNVIRRNLWGGRLEIQAVHDGCLNSLTRDQDFKIIVYSVGQDGNIRLDRDFLHTMPDDDKNRWPIRVLFVDNNHFHRIYFDDPNIQKINYDIENRNIEMKKSIDIDLLSERPTTAQLKDMGLLESSDNKWEMSPRDDEWGGLSQSEKEEQRKTLYKITNTKTTGKANEKTTGKAIEKTTVEANEQKIVEIDENSDEYEELHDKNIHDPFMIMGYQNGQPNLLYKTVCKEVNFENNIFNVETYRCKIFIPREADINDRKFTRYPNPTMLNVDGKTIVNISLHLWADIWNETNDEENPGQKSLNIYMYDTKGVEEVKGNEDADFISISLKEKPIQYMRHGDFGMRYSPDTGVFALDDKEDNPYCAIHVTDPSDGREMVLMINFYRKEKDFLHEPKLGGKTRRKTRKHRRRRTMRKSFRRKK